ncbi:phosphatidylinositol 4-phosphate 5-kinase-like protein 1 [Suncus etruscus]|uniref:phosphatidylinositol 4-phosphate 5-kinase-like protein 1 n=1 Tax=Suncus etruscus TaxID=109475 RepID=UPI00210F3485|nr:phosphatidylinositol 4-phosphate 5-kinase-like protein 1 [Suncus etruscus]
MMAHYFCVSCPQVLPPSPEARGNVDVWVTCRHRRNIFWRCRDRQPHLGLFEIGPDHELYRLTCMMQAGLWAAIQASMEHPPVGLPSEEDFAEVLTQAHEGFEMDTLAGPAFAWVRHSLGLSEKDYQKALGPGGPYLQFVSNSRSKASFFLSQDQRFFVKTQQRQEVRVLLTHLPRYVQHLQKHPYSLLSRFLGMHSLRVARGKKKYFIIMQSIFYPASGLFQRYDFKGCEVDRWVNPALEEGPFLVLKDLNFQGKTIHLGPQRTWLLRQMELDTAFLRDLSLMDYSLLLSFHQLQEGERNQARSFSSSVRSMQGAQSLEEAAEQKSRLLFDRPQTPHILDGPEQRYFLGLVDLATVYGLRKRLEHLWKMLWYPGRSFSTVNPTRYASRLCQWVEAHTE